jgi:hypothetical protein
MVVFDREDWTIKRQDGGYALRYISDLLRTHDDFNSSDPRDQVIGYQKIHMACFLTRGATKVILSHIEGPQAWSVTSSSANVGRFRKVCRVVDFPNQEPCDPCAVTKPSPTRTLSRSLSLSIIVRTIRQTWIH